MTVRPRFLAMIVLIGVLAMASPARADIDVTLDISGSTGGPTIDQGAPQTPARTGFDPLPLGGIAVLLIAVGFLGLARQKRADEGGSQ